MNRSPLSRAARLALALLAGIVAAITVPVAARQQPPVTLEVSAGYGGTYRINHWFPITVTLANDGPDIAATLDLRFIGSEGSTFRQAVDLPSGARKRVTLLVQSGDFARTAELRLFNGPAELLRRIVRLEPADVSQFLVGVVSSDPALLNSLGAMTLDGSSGTVVAHLDPATLPEEAAALSGLDALFIHDTATAELSPGQREALSLWVSLGGQLIVGGGVSADRTAAGLPELLPVSVGALGQPVPTTPLERLARRTDLDETVATVVGSAITPLPGARSLDPGGLLSEIERGAGRVIFANFDLAALRAWGGEVDLWERVVRIEPRMNIGYTYRWRNENLLRSALQLPGLSIPSWPLLLGLVLLYIGIVGPANFLLVRRLRRPDLAWLTVPVIVAASLATTYLASLAIRGTTPQVIELAIVQGFEGRPTGYATSFVGVFSPQRRTYSFAIDGPGQLSASSLDGFSRATEPVLSSETDSAIPEFLVDVSSLRTTIFERPVASLPRTRSAITIAPTLVEGTITYEGPAPLLGATLVRGDSAQVLGDLAPGQQVEVRLRSGISNFPGNTPPIGSPEFDEASILNSLFDFDRFAFGGPNFTETRGIPEADAAYLIGWTEGPQLSVRLDGQPVASQATTLYMIRLERAP